MIVVLVIIYYCKKTILRSITLGFYFRTILSAVEKPLQLRPHAVVLLTNKEVAAKPLNSSGKSSVRSGTALFGVIGGLLLTRYFL